MMTSDARGGIRPQRRRGVAWDNNDTCGTPGWRTEPSQHDATVRTPPMPPLSLLAPGAAAADIDWHAPPDR